MDIKERIKEYQKVVGITDYRLEKLMSKGKGWWGNCKNPTGENLAIIFNVLPELSAEWVMRGKGDMVIREESEPISNYTERYYQSMIEVKQQRISDLESELASLKAKMKI